MLDRKLLCHGSSDPLPEPTLLRAGPAFLLYENGGLRHICCGAGEILLGVYVAVRDHDWGTIPGQQKEIRREVQADSFCIEFTSEHRQGEVHFSWRGTITGEADGTVTFTMDGEVRAAFRRNRIGFCVLHPISLAGRACTLEHTGGAVEQSLFPEAIAPRQPFFNLRAITHEVTPGLRAEVRMEGETFETEDQRNWTDASYKTYCTPLGQPFPVTVQAGTKVRQSVTLRLIGAAPVVVESSAPARTVSLLRDARPLPPLGLCLSSQSVTLSARETERLKALHLSHLRAEIDFRKRITVEAQVQSAMDSAQACGVPLELALHLTPAAKIELESFARVVDELRLHLARFLVFHVEEKSTSRQWLDLARSALGRFDLPIGAGTNAYFTELNRGHPPEGADVVAYSVNPQVHATDNMTLVENLAALGATVWSARKIIGARTLLVGPVTLRKRWNPDATGPEPGPKPGEMPYQVDPRQMSLFGAGWTAISLKYLAEAGADLLTYYETAGWRGVMETEAGSPLPEKFPSLPGCVFPLYHVFADTAEFSGGEVVSCRASHPLDVDALVLRKGTRCRALAANFTAMVQQVYFPQVAGSAQLRLLDATNAKQAMTEPETWRAAPVPQVAVGAVGLTIELPPFGLARLDWNQEKP